MSDRMDNEQLKAKIGQILYNEFITGRLKDEVLSQFAQRGNIDLSYSLGPDTNGDEIRIDARIYRASSGLERVKQEMDKGKSLRGQRKYIFFAMSSEKQPPVSDETLRSSFDDMLAQSLPWWDRYRARSSIEVRDWRLDQTIVTEGKTISSAMKKALRLQRLSENQKPLPSSLV
jgi:hypothetical protein